MHFFACIRSYFGDGIKNVGHQMLNHLAATWRSFHLIKRQSNVRHNCGMRCMAFCTILLKWNIVHIITMKIGYKNFGYHSVIAILIERNGYAVLIFKDIWATSYSKESLVMDEMKMSFIRRGNLFFYQNRY